MRPEALSRLQAARISIDGLRSKSWDEFAKPGAPKLDFVFTVCDNAANETCPIFYSPSNRASSNTGDAARACRPMTAHWGMPDPAAVQGSPEEIERAFRKAFILLDRRISRLLSLSLASMDKFALKRELDLIGREP